MGTSLTMQVPAHIQALVAANAGKRSAVQNALLTEGYAYPKISIRGSRYRLVEDGVETVVGPTLDVVIVGANPKTSKIWYSKPYDGADGVRPDCFSNDGVTPDASIEKPFAANCGTCPNNVVGSKITPSGAKGTICGSQRHLAVVASADPSKIYGLTVTVSAMKGMREYVKDLSNYGLAPEHVVTELGFDETASFPKITFKHKGFVGEKALKNVLDICQSPEIATITRQEPSAPRLPAPASTPQLLGPQVAADEAAAVSKVRAEVAAEATKAIKAAKATPAPAPAPVSAPVSQVVDTEADPMAAMEAKLNSLFSDD